MNKPYLNSIKLFMKPGINPISITVVVGVYTTLGINTVDETRYKHDRCYNEKKKSDVE